MTLEHYSVKKLLQPLFIQGRAQPIPTDVKEISAYRASQEKTIWDEYLRPVNPHRYKVDLSDSLWQLRKEMLEAAKGLAHPARLRLLGMLAGGELCVCQMIAVLGLAPTAAAAAAR